MEIYEANPRLAFPWPDAGAGVDGPPLRARRVRSGAGVDHGPRLGGQSCRCRGRRSGSASWASPRLRTPTAGSPSSFGRRAFADRRSRSRRGTSATIPSARRSCLPAGRSRTTSSCSRSATRAARRFNRSTPTDRRPASGRRSFPYAQRVDSTAFDELAGPTDFVSALAGRVVGLDVTSASVTGGSALAILRGYHSILGNTQPLFVLDGVPLENTSFVVPGQAFGSGGFDYGSPIQGIEPSEVATVQVLRGPAAAIWGGRAANGVILITTRGGRGLSGFEVSASQTASSESALRLPAFQNAYGQGLNGQFSFFDGAGGGTNDGVAQNWGPALQGQAITQASLTVPRLGDVRPWLARPGNVADFFGGGTTLTTVASAQQAGANENYRFSLDRRELERIRSNELVDATGRGAWRQGPTSRRRSRSTRTWG